MNNRAALISEYPSNFLPKGAVTIEGYDPAAPEGDTACVVKGMYVDGEFHIQEVIYVMTDYEEDQDNE